MADGRVVRDPRWRKLMQWRRHGWNGVRHAGCQGCEWCVPESDGSYWTRQRRAWREEANRRG